MKTKVQQPTEPPVLLTIPHAGALIGKKSAAVYALIRAGRLPAVLVGNSLRVPRKGIEALVDEAMAGRAEQR